MKKEILSLMAGVAMILTSCSSVQVTDSYQAPDASKSWSESFLVVTRTSDRGVRSVFENAMVSQLQSKGVKAVSSLDIYPNLDVAKNPTSDEIDVLEKMFIKDGYNGVIINELTDVQQETNTYADNPNPGFYGYYPGYYYGFGGFYGAPYIDPWGGMPTTYSTSTYNVYDLKTAVYDIARAASKQLISVVSVEMTDPSSFEANADDYAKKVVKELNIN